MLQLSSHVRPRKGGVYPSPGCAMGRMIALMGRMNCLAWAAVSINIFNCFSVIVNDNTASLRTFMYW